MTGEERIIMKGINHNQGTLELLYLNTLVLPSFESRGRREVGY